MAQNTLMFCAIFYRYLNMIAEINDSKIYKLSNSFYDYYDSQKYPELLTKVGRGYNIIVLYIENINGLICLPFRSNMNHNIGYRFRHTARSCTHHSGIDFSKLVIINDFSFIGNEILIDTDEYNEFIRHKNKIHKEAIKYINRYRELVLNNLTESREFTRKYKYSTLKYFHEFLDL